MPLRSIFTKPGLQEQLIRTYLVLLFTTSITLFIFRINDEKADNAGLVYAIILGFIGLFSAYIQSRKKYRRQFGKFRRYIRNKLSGTDFEERVAVVQNEILPEFKISMFKEILKFHLVLISTFVAFVALEGIGRFFSAVIGGLLTLYSYMQISVNESKLLKEYLHG